MRIQMRIIKIKQNIFWNWQINNDAIRGIVKENFF